ncbi:hypothetical protein ACHHYP_16666 [Achlya hypogyna]|uniref:Uncharacterized protein n=1 Tax=Achlya hypogyna TaxID=1202772 RepID=A0A1V9Y648_ACHHY|nr:hypothetical protein ACHHYP_16666 [Achlya hypogyna]
MLDTVMRVPHLTQRATEFCLFVNHANMIYLVDPKGRDPSLPRHTCDKGLRWSLILMGSQIHADKPNEVLHFDFLYMGHSTTGEV